MKGKSPRSGDGETYSSRISHLSIVNPATYVKIFLMKVLNPEPGFASYIRIFREVQNQKQKVIVWQVTSSGRLVSETILSSFSPETMTLNILPGAEIFNPGLPLYFYFEVEQVIFKSKIESSGSTYIVAGFPNEMRILDESEESVNFKRNHLSTVWVTKTATSSVDRYNDHVRVKSMSERSSRDQDFLNGEFNPVNLDEEDKIFADKRESPRVRPKADKLVKVLRKGESKIHVMKLFDLSRGGMGFLTFSPDEFPKGTDVFITGFDAFDLDDPLIGTVMAQRAVDDSNVEFKIGVKFNEGQE